MFARTIQRVSRPVSAVTRRSITTLEGNPHIVRNQTGSQLTLLTNVQYIFRDDRTINSHILSLLPTSPPKSRLAIGTTTKLPPTPDSLDENHEFLNILQSVISQHAFQDPDVISQAQAFASTAGSSLGSGGAFFPRQKKRRGPSYGGGGGAGGDGAGGASSQGGAGGGGHSGYIHVSDQRNPPDYGRIAWPEDIFGSLEVDAAGKFVDGHGNYQSSGSYRVVTRDGMSVRNLDPRYWRRS